MQIISTFEIFHIFCFNQLLLSMNSISLFHNKVIVGSNSTLGEAAKKVLYGQAIKRERGVVKSRDIKEKRTFDD